MLCPKCSKDDTKVLDSRETDSNRAVRRRRECIDCKHRFTTFERIEMTNFLVIKKDGTRETYDREKLEKGIQIACQKRKISHEEISDLITGLEKIWSNMGKEISSKNIGEGVMDALRELDDVAYIRFASVYRQFKDIDSFKKELDKLEG